MKPILQLLISFTLTISSVAQSIDDYFLSQETSDFEKLYLHTDREYYFIGDTLWFSPYIVSASNNKLQFDDCNLYVELIDTKGTVLKEEKFLLDKGICSGYFNLDYQISTAGIYILRAYTDRLKPLGEEAFFRKTIKINDSKQSIPVSKDDDKIVLEFYPEGGFLLNDNTNQMAFIARNKDGQRVNINGILTGNKGTRIPIKTDYNGTGPSVSPR